MPGLWALLREARYALPYQLERFVHGPGARAAARRCARLERAGFESTVGYFQARDARPEAIVAGNLEVARRLAARGVGACLAVKAPPLAFDPGSLEAIARAADGAGLTLMFDAHAPKDADETLAAVSSLLRDFPGTGFALPARWLRSRGDAATFRDSSARIRLIKGEWADPEWRGMDVEASYLALAARLAGRRAPVGVATHDPALAKRALALLLDAGTPCELEQLRGLPARRTTAVARRLGVPVRIYVPFGPGWWPYALDKALARPYLLSWMIRDRLAFERHPGLDRGSMNTDCGQSPPAAFMDSGLRRNDGKA
ncbi:MAG: proline dehydrogenase [Sphingomonadales bacterium]|jgi:proline dehydrogenase|nr:proline dehydrogenase [Sphingomonadales bacterium]